MSISWISNVYCASKTHYIPHKGPAVGWFGVFFVASQNKLFNNPIAYDLGHNAAHVKYYDIFLFLVHRYRKSELFFSPLVFENSKTAGEKYRKLFIGYVT